ncbi:MAG TPA: DUF4886 domain-containing protein [bacterium]|jgi:hypothetical protein|nr:DUF4886 domain-containing protein [bacterium]
MKKLILLVLLSFGVGGCADQQPIGPKISIFFIGNSYTYANELPNLFVSLAKSGRREVEVTSFTPGGATLFPASNSEKVLSEIAELKSTFVVLQEQSVVPALEQFRQSEMYPAVRVLVEKIREAKSTPLLYMTWGRENGLPEYSFKDYSSMQDQITTGYLNIAKETGTGVAPVGEAWRLALKLDPGLKLWQADGSHPTLEGSYLAACVFYAVIYRVSPEGLDYRAGLSRGSAAALQTVAAQTVLTDASQWTPH